jgi:hypothetical protein
MASFSFFAVGFPKNLKFLELIYDTTGPESDLLSSHPPLLLTRKLLSARVRRKKAFCLPTRFRLRVEQGNGFDITNM